MEDTREQGKVGMEFMSLTEAQKRLPAINGKRPHIQTVVRWASKGVLVNGQWVKLRCTRIGRRHVTTQVWLAEFLAAAGK